MNISKPKSTKENGNNVYENIYQKLMSLFVIHRVSIDCNSQRTPSVTLLSSDFRNESKMMASLLMPI